METALSVGRTRTCVIPIRDVRVLRNGVSRCDATVRNHASSMRVTRARTGHVSHERAQTTCHTSAHRPRVTRARTDHVSHERAQTTCHTSAHRPRISTSTSRYSGDAITQGSNRCVILRVVCASRYMDQAPTPTQQQFVHATYVTSTVRTRHTTYVISTVRTRHATYVTSTVRTRHATYVTSTVRTRHATYVTSTVRTRHTTYVTSTVRTRHTTYVTSTVRTRHKYLDALMYKDLRMCNSVRSAPIRYAFFCSATTRAAA